MAVAVKIRDRYLSPSGRWWYGFTTLRAINRYYASDPHWADKVAVLANVARRPRRHAQGARPALRPPGRRRHARSSGRASPSTCPWRPARAPSCPPPSASAPAGRRSPSSRRRADAPPVVAAPRWTRPADRPPRTRRPPRPDARRRSPASGGWTSRRATATAGPCRRPTTPDPVDHRARGRIARGDRRHLASAGDGTPGRDGAQHRPPRRSTPSRDGTATDRRGLGASARPDARGLPPGRASPCRTSIAADRSPRGAVRRAAPRRRSSWSASPATRGAVGRARPSAALVTRSAGGRSRCLPASSVASPRDDALLGRKPKPGRIALAQADEPGTRRAPR